MPPKKQAKGNKYEENRILALSDEYVPRLSPALAAEIGLNQSVLFLQIEFLIAISNNQRDGKRWTYQSITDLQKMFPFWSRETINRAVKSLQTMGLIEVQNFNRHKYDRTRWFAINEANVAKLKSIRLLGGNQYEPQSGQFGTGSSLDETTIPNTTTNITTNNSTKSTTNEKETLSASPSASSILETQSSIQRGLEHELISPPPENNRHSKSHEGQHIDPASQIFDDWREVMECPEAIFNKKSRTAVASRLKEGYSINDLKLATRGILFSKWHMGKNDEKLIYDNLALICRDGNQVEKFKTLALANGIEVNVEIRKHDYVERRAINQAPRKELHYAITYRDENGNLVQEEPYEVIVGPSKGITDFSTKRI
jgi:hypothetical protein